MVFPRVPLDAYHFRGWRTATRPCKVVCDPREFLMVDGDHLVDASLYTCVGARVSNEANPLLREPLLRHVTHLCSPIYSVTTPTLAVAP